MNLLTLSLSAAIALGLTSCAGTSLTLGLTGKTATGADYVVGLQIPFDLRKAKDFTPTATGKTPVEAAK